MNIKRVFNFLGVDLAVAFVILGRGWGVIAGVVNVVLISHFLGKTEQGFYYTFNSVVALQIFFELGLSLVIAQFVSHEMATLTLADRGRLTGAERERERVLSLVRFSVKWYGAIAPVLLVVVAPLGYAFFAGTSTAAAQDVHWRLPWLALVFFTAMNLIVSPLVSIAEGIGLVAKVAKMRLVQAITGSVLLWSALALDWGLMSIAVMPAAIFVVTAIWLWRNIRDLVLDSLRESPLLHQVSWRDELFPMQWRIALSWLCGYLIFQLFTPIAFKFQSPEIAGQLGMSLTITTAMSTVAMSWVVTKMPTFGRLISIGDLQSVDTLFRRAALQSTVILTVMAVALFCCVWVLPSISEQIASRILRPADFAILGTVAIANHVIFCEASYVRAFKVERYLPHAVVLAVAIIAICGPLGIKVSVSAMLAGYAAVMSLLGVTYSHYIYSKFRADHSCRS